MNIKNMIATIQVYIHCTKGKEVNISPDLPRELPQLLDAYTTSVNWLSKNAVTL